MAQKLVALGFLLVAAQVVLCALPKDFYTDEVVVNCRRESGYDGDIDISFTDPAYPKGAKCVWACTFDKQKLFKPDGSMDKEAAVAMIEKAQTGEVKEKMLKSVDECLKEVKVVPDKCETAFQYIKCSDAKV